MHKSVVIAPGDGLLSVVKSGVMHSVDVVDFECVDKFGSFTNLLQFLSTALYTLFFTFFNLLATQLYTLYTGIITTMSIYKPYISN